MTAFKERLPYTVSGAGFVPAMLSPDSLASVLYFVLAAALVLSILHDVYTRLVSK